MPATPASPVAPAREAFTRRTALGLVAIAVGGALIRIALLQTQGFRPDEDQFALWAGQIAAGGLPNAYDHGISFGPVMTFLWGLLGAIEPGFRTAVDASDPWLRALLKIPAVVADLALIGLTVTWFRDRPRWALIGAAVVAFHPALIYVSAWWGQYESVYVLTGIAAILAAASRRNALAAALIAVSLLTKPQAVVFVAPLAAWFWISGYRLGGVRGGLRELARTGLVGAVVLAVLWVPFLAAGGPLHYLDNVRGYQGATYAILSLRTWNVWWLVQELAGGGAFIADDVSIAGPVSLRVVGIGVAAVLELIVVLGVLRDPRPRTLILATAASVLVLCGCLTQMHERYPYAALVLLTLLLPDPRLRWLGIAFGVIFALNLVAAVPPSPAIGDLLPVSGFLGVVASLAMVALMIVSLVELHRGERSATGLASAAEPGLA